MSTEQDKDIEKFLVVVHKGIRKHGIKKILRSIQAIDFAENSAYHQEILDYIFKVVTEDFCITKDDLLRRDKRGVVTIARKIAIIIASENLAISDDNLAFQFQRVRQVIYNAKQEFKNLDRNDKFDKRFFERYDSINEKVVKYIGELK